MANRASNVISFRDPNAPLKGEDREIALVACREFADQIAAIALHDAIRQLSRRPNCRDLGILDVLPVLAEAFQHQVKAVPYLGMEVPADA